jgi:hypothetical protein
MSLLRKTAHLLTLLACVSLSAWAMGCGDDGTGSVTSDGSSEAPPAMSDDNDSGETPTTPEGGDGLDVVPPMPEGDGDSSTEGE